MTALVPSSSPLHSGPPSPSASGLFTLFGLMALYMAASSAPTPLYRLYQAAWGFSPAMLTLVFAVYAFSLLGALLTTGALSDHLGRKPVVLLALALEGAAMLLFTRAADAHGLIAARALQGWATGMAAAALGAALLDVDRERGTLANSLAPMLGMALGGVLAGELAEHAPWPLRLVFWLLLAAFAVAALMVLRLPETVARSPGALASLRPRVRVPAAARTPLWRVAPMAVAVWALGGFHLSLGPSLMRAVTGSAAASGWVVCVLTATAGVAVWQLRSWPAQRLLRVGAGMLVAGLALTLMGIHTGSLAGLLAATAVAGIGFGIGFQGAIRVVMPLAQPHERAGLLAAIYVLSYLAFSLPALAAGALVPSMGLVPVAETYCALLIVMALLPLLRRPPAVQTPCSALNG